MPWGAGVPVKEFSRRLGMDTRDEIRAVFVTHNETATGVTSDVAAVRRALDENFHDALLFVDGVSSVASLDFQMDAWQVDLVVTGSQKGLMLPAGLGILGGGGAISSPEMRERAIGEELVQHRTVPIRRVPLRARARHRPLADQVDGDGVHVMKAVFPYTHAHCR